MPKVDPSGLHFPERGPRPDFTKHPPTRAPYNREPYVRAIVDGAEVDGKAIGWTDIHVHVKWVDDGETRVRWVSATDVRRITRDESRWRDPYDEVYGLKSWLQSAIQSPTG